MVSERRDLASEAGVVRAALVEAMDIALVEVVAHEPDIALVEVVVDTALQEVLVVAASQVAVAAGMDAVGTAVEEEDTIVNRVTRG